MPKSVWKNRIVGYEERSPLELKANPKNWRLHPKAQITALQDVLGEVGLVQNVIFNKRTGLMIDGHLRVELALKEKQKTVPVTIVDLSEEEEALILATLDPLSAMAAANHEQLSDLLGQIGEKGDGVQRLLVQLGKGESISLDGPAIQTDEPMRTFAFNLTEEKAGDVDKAFTAARDKAPQGVSDNEIFHHLVTTNPSK